MGSFPPVQAVVRTVRLLQALNRQPVSSIDTLHRQTGIPKPSVVRLLQTLVGLGLVRHAPQHGAYYLTSQVRSLSSGYHSEPRVVEVAAPILDAMTERIKWPMALAMFDGDSAVVRYSTIPKSPLALLHSTINRRLSLVSRALGRAYLAFCEPDEVEAIIAALRSSQDSEDVPVRDAGAFRKTLADIRRKGYASRDPTVRPVSNTIAVPVIDAGHVIASIGITFFASALTVQQAADRYLNDLNDAARRISGMLADLDRPARPEPARPRRSLSRPKRPPPR